MSRLEFTDLTKHYGPIKALEGFTHSFASGQVHALIGKNGSGKSTLIKMLSGAIRPSRGGLALDGVPMAFDTPADALAAGIVTVYQELSLVPGLTVAENLFLGRLPKRGLLVDWARLYREAQALLADIGAQDIDPRAEVASLSVGRQQIVEIAKAMSLHPKVLLLDEPTSALAQAEVNQLFDLVRRLEARGVTILYISHRLSELPRIARTVTAIRDGHFVGSVAMEEADPQTVLDLMFGDLPPLERPQRKIDTRAPALELRNLRLAPYLKDVSFDLHRGEVLGIAGMLGAGRTELLHALFGARPFDSGQLTVKGRPYPRPTIAQMKAAGLGYASEDRKAAGLVQELSSHANLCLAALDRIAPSGWTSLRHEDPHVAKQIKRLQIKIGDAMLPVSALSGGNQQKIVVGGWLNNAPDILLFDEPGRGVDVQAKHQIYQIIWEMAEQGLSCIVVSTELEDLTECCDRILVLHGGRITEEFHNHGLDPKALYAACMRPDPEQPPQPHPKRLAPEPEGTPL
ncbi:MULTISPECIES: sugar ABC transporter ATP-binding protein [Thioclava]|uniref:Sugar ABC transporter ATP-binding protein n=1 Tax=Thioclava litoralis TaxID=3076557 RepID=A0ABZ1E4N3_9RHOB|nr:sugar ABC transporter ATP-binding protein [Thioclava sp. FTW29]